MQYNICGFHIGKMRRLFRSAVLNAECREDSRFGALENSTYRRAHFLLFLFFAAICDLIYSIRLLM